MTNRITALLARRLGACRGGAPERTAPGPAPDRSEPLGEEPEALRIRSSLDRATVLAAVRHELRLPLGADAVPAGALHLERATDSSITVASVRRRSCFRGELVVRDVEDGCTGEYRVNSWHQRQSRRDQEQPQSVRDVIAHAVMEVDAAAHVDRCGPPEG